jgi:hypothetical protein
VLCAGQVYESSLTVKDQTGPPSSVTLAITKPDGTLVTPAPTLASGSQAGADWVVTYDYTLPAAGLYGFTWATQGPGTAPPTDWVNVTDYRSVISLADAQAYLGAEGMPAGQLQDLCNTATRLAETICGTLVVRQFTDIIPGRDRHRLRLPHGPLPAADSVTSVTSLADPTVTWATADLAADPAAADIWRADGLPFTSGPWQAVYTGGRTVISGLAVQGVKEILWDLYATERGVTRDTDSPDLAEAASFEASMAGTGMPGYRIPPRALACLNAERVTIPGFA